MTTLIHSILAALVALWHVADSAALAVCALARDACAALRYVARRASVRWAA